MMRFFVFVLSCCIFISCSKQPTKQEFHPVDMGVDDLVEFVVSAADLLNERGEDVFGDFKQYGSNWFHDDLYLFVWDMDGYLVSCPAEIGFEGDNMLGLEDSNGKPIGHQFYEAVYNDNGSGWCHYQWCKPHEKNALWKSTYLVRAVSPKSGCEYIVGAGLYNMQLDKFVLEGLVKEAVDLIEEKGEDAFFTIQDCRNKFFYNNTYIFVMNEQGVELVNPAFPDYVGKNILNVRDINGLYVVREEIKLAQEEGEGWLQCHWVKLDTQEVAPEHAFIKSAMVGDKMYIVGSAIYDD
jgi:signal transduction histidine kinase